MGYYGQGKGGGARQGAAGGRNGAGKVDMAGRGTPQTKRAGEWALSPSPPKGHREHVRIPHPEPLAGPPTPPPPTRDGTERCMPWSATRTPAQPPPHACRATGRTQRPAMRALAIQPHAPPRPRRLKAAPPGRPTLPPPGPRRWQTYVCRKGEAEHVFFIGEDRILRPRHHHHPPVGAEGKTAGEKRGRQQKDKKGRGRGEDITDAGRSVSTQQLFTRGSAPLKPR